MSYNDNINVKSTVNINPVSNKINNEKPLDNRSASLFNIVATDSYEINDKDTIDYNAIDRQGSLEMKFHTAGRSTPDCFDPELKCQLAPELYKSFKIFIKTNFEKYVALKVDDT